MSDWQTFKHTPPALFDVLARYYDAGLNRFLVQRFCNCFVQDFQVIWPSPFPGDGRHVNLNEAGYRAIRWMDLPEIPDDLKVPGPALPDYSESAPSPTHE